MTSGAHNFTVQKGESWQALVSVAISGTSIDFTGYTVEMDVREAFDSSAELLTFTVDNSRVSISTTTITLSLNKTDSAALTFDKGVYDLRVISPGGTAFFPLRGNFIVQKTVTR